MIFYTAMQLCQRANQLQIVRFIPEPLFVLTDEILGSRLLLRATILLLEQHRLGLVL